MPSASIKHLDTDLEIRIGPYTDTLMTLRHIVSVEVNTGLNYAYTTLPGSTCAPTAGYAKTQWSQNTTSGANVTITAMLNSCDASPLNPDTLFATLLEEYIDSSEEYSSPPFDDRTLSFLDGDFTMVLKECELVAIGVTAQTAATNLVYFFSWTYHCKYIEGGGMTKPDRDVVDVERGVGP